jgi:phosphoserine phosphatase RsbU/P
VALTLDPTADAPQVARRYVTGALTSYGAEEHNDVAALLTSELVTNAVVHAASAVEIEVVADDGGVTVRVRDADTGPLVMRASGGSELDEGGRGFLLVDRLADGWGTEHRGGRKTVWFRLSTAAATAQPARLAAASTLTPDAEVVIAEKRLRTLLLRPELRREMTFEQHVGEVLARIVDAVDGRGGHVAMIGQADAVASCGHPQAPCTVEHELVLDDRRFGSLVVHLDSQPGEADQHFLELAAERLSLLAADHGITRADAQRESELDFLAEATEMLAGSTSVPLALTLATQIVVPRLADWCAAYVIDDVHGTSRVTATHRREERIDAVVQMLDREPELDAAIATAAVEATAVRLPVTTPVSGQRTHVAVLPLLSRARVVGVLVLGRAAPLDAVLFMAAAELCRRAAIAVDNAGLHEEQAAAANALQASLLPSALPIVPGFDLAARYHSASPGLSVGGDFYDAFTLPDGSAVAAIGDVCGKGAEAASVTGTSRDVLRLLLLDGTPLPDALRRLNRALLHHPSSSRFCTVALTRFERNGDDVVARICLAGHPEPVLLTADGTTELVGTPGDLLGVLPEDSLTLLETEVRLEPGDCLVLYTDGVTERRDGRRMFGQHGLRAALATAAGLDADAVAHRLEAAAESFVDTDLRDDLAILVIRRLPS